MKKVLFIDRDGTIIKEPADDFQVDSLEKMEFLPYAISSLAALSKLDFEMAMVSNQDGMGSDVFPEKSFRIPQEKMMNTLKGEGVRFDEIFIDPSWPGDNSPNRKPGTGMLGKYSDRRVYDMAGSFVIGDRITDIELAKNLGAKGILLLPREEGMKKLTEAGLEKYAVLVTDNWREIYSFIRLGERRVEIKRRTRETDISLVLDLDGYGESSIDTGLSFFNHMLEQITYHSPVSMRLSVKGDLNVDEHHTMEDIGIVIGEALFMALGDKLGLERYGFALPMDECDALVLLDFGGRIDFRWDVSFAREMIGDVPTEMFEHFFKSLAQNAKCNLHIEARGTNGHHKIEGVFKAFARALKMAVRRDAFNYSLPSSKGLL